MKVKVLLFAQAKQIAGVDSIEVEVGDTAKVSDLKSALATAQPELASLLSRSNIALDQKYATDEDELLADVEVAMIPPVSGG